MIPFRPTAQSQILRAARILHVRVDAFVAGAFRPDPPFIQRDVALELTLLAVCKGEVLEAPGDRMRAQVTQTASEGTRFAALPGVWSSIEMEPGRELVAFAGPEGVTAAGALVDPVCFGLLPAELAVNDVLSANSAAGADGIELRLAVLIEALERRGTTFGPLFASYLVDRVAEVFPDRLADLAAVLRILEKPELGAAARFALCSGVVARFILVGRVELELLRCLLESLCRLLTMPEAATLHESLASTWIPNLVGIEGSMPPIDRDDIFLGGSLPVQVADALRKFANPGAVRPLLAWLRS